MKKTIIKVILLGTLYLGSNQIKAQINHDLVSLNLTNHKTETKEIIEQVAVDSSQTTIKNNGGNGNTGWGIGINFSSNGIGGELSKELTKNKKLTGRVSFSYLPYSMDNISYDFSQTKLIAKADITLGAIGAYLDWHPFGNSFKITGGAVYMLTQVKGNAYVRDSVKQGEITIPPNSVGKISVGIETLPIAPYLGIGFGRAVPKNRVGFGVEMGTYYIGSPKLSFVCTGLLEPTSNQEVVLKENLKSYQWLPQILFKLTIKISK